MGRKEPGRHLWILRPPMQTPIGQGDRDAERAAATAGAAARAAPVIRLGAGPSGGYDRLVANPCPFAGGMA